MPKAKKKKKRDPKPPRVPSACTRCGHRVSPTLKTLNCGIRCFKCGGNVVAMQFT